MAERQTRRGPGGPGSGPRGGFRKPKDLRGTLKQLMGYLGRYKPLLMIVVVLLPVALTVMFPEVFPVALPAGTGWLFLAALVLLACSVLASVRVCEHKEY